MALQKNTSDSSVSIYQKVSQVRSLRIRKHIQPIQSMTWVREHDGQEEIMCGEYYRD